MLQANVSIKGIVANRFFSLVSLAWSHNPLWGMDTMMCGTRNVFKERLGSQKDYQYGSLDTGTGQLEAG
jgi:hypothetical protein